MTRHTWIWILIAAVVALGAVGLFVGGVGGRVIRFIGLGVGVVLAVLIVPELGQSNRTNKDGNDKHGF